MATASTAPVTIKGKSLSQDALRKFFRNPTALVGLGIVSFFIIASLLAPLISPYDAKKDRNFRMRLVPPSWTLSQQEREAKKLGFFSLPLGADQQGRDMLTRVWHGGRISLRVGLMAVAIAASIGVLLGLIAGYAGGWVDTAIVWLVDILLAFPGILLAISIVAILGPNLRNALIAISITEIPKYIRITRSVVLSVRESEYVQAAQALGTHSPRIVFLHILPNSLSPIIVQITLSIGTAILDVAALGFLGLGAQPPAPEWGAMIKSGYEKFLQAPHMSIVPGIAIFLSVVGFNLLGDGIRDALDPRLNK